MKRIICFVVITAFYSLELFPQAISPEIPFLLNMDYSRFQYDDQSCYLEIYYGFHPLHISFNFIDNEFQGGIILSTKIMDKKTDKFVIDERLNLKIAESDTSELWYKFPIINKYNYVLPAGDYTIEILAIDSLGTSRRDSIKLDLKIEPYGAELTSSDIEMCNKITSSDKKDGQFYKNSLEVVPHPSLIFGSATAPAMFYYVEIYHLDTDENYTIKTEIINSNGSVARQKIKPRKFPSANSIEVGTIPTTSYSSGKYEFQFIILDENQRELVKTIKVFYIFNPHIETALQASLEPDKETFEMMSAMELSQEFDYAKYVATDLEKEIFENLDSNQAKLDFLFKLWLKIEKGRAEIPGIRRYAYLDRIKTANEKYKALGKEGWRTDRGRIHVIYGEADETERIPSDANTKPHELWKYHTIENGVEFIFIDLGYGAYRLVHSTKRGELFDQNWQQYLR